MSKKIAQLTKVIFHLNSKNEDNQDDVAALSDAYETEIDQVTNINLPTPGCNSIQWRCPGARKACLAWAHDA